MKTPAGFRFARIGSLAALLTTHTAHAALEWDGSDIGSSGAQGGLGIWDMNSTANWWDGSGDTVWPDTGTDNDAIFGATAGIVTVASVTANDIRFSTTGYTLSSSTLTLNGTTPTITTDPGVSTTISSAIAGADGLTHAGLGRLALSGSNSYTGGTVIDGGLITISSDGTGATNPLGAYPAAFQASNIYLKNGGGFGQTSNTIGANGSSMTLAGNRGIELGSGLQNIVKPFRASLGISGIIKGSGGIILNENAEYNNGGTGGGGRYTFSGINTYSGDTIPLDLGTQDPGLRVGNTRALQNTTFDYNTTDVPATTGFVIMWDVSNPILGGLKGNKNLNISFQTNPTNIQIGNNDQNTIFSGAISSSTAGVGLTKIGTGTLTLSGANSTSWTGGAIVSSGTLVGTTTSALGFGKLTVNSNATFAYLPTAAGALNLSTGVITLQDLSTIGTAVGGSTNQSAITSSAAAVVTGTIAINVSGIPGVGVPAGTTTNNLITAGSGLNGAAFNLGKIFNTTNFSIGALSQSDTAVTLEVTQQTALTSETWQGGLAGGENVWAVSDGSTSSNWTTDGFSGTSLTPGSAADVLFTNINSPTNQTAMVLGANMAIRSLTVDDTSAVTLNADGYSLTISNAAGITVNNGAGAVTLNSFLTLGAAQTWTNNSENPLTIGGDISNAGNGLTISGSGDTTISGQIRYGTGGLTMNGSGSLTLSGNNVSFKGNTTINSGVVKAGSPYAFGMAISNINGFPYGWGYANVAFGSASTGVIQLNGNHVVLSSLGTHATVGSPVVENASSTPVTLTVTEGTSTGTATAHTYAGILQDGTGGGSLGLQVTKGTLTLKGVNTYTGDTTVAGGTLVLFDDAGLTFVVNNSSCNRIGGAGTATLDGDFTIDTSAVTVASGFWMLVNTATLIETFGDHFTVAGAGWSESGDVWTKVDGAKTWTFTEATGVLTLASSGGLSAYDSWAAAKGLTGLPGSGTDPASGADPDKDGRGNLTEFAFNGDPLSGSDNGKVYALSEDSDFDDPDAQRELILTVAVRAGTPAFTGSPSPTASQDGITYTIEGSLTLGGFATAVNVVPTPVTIDGITPLPAAGAGYVYRSFSLSGSNGLPGKGFLRAKVTQP